jgi:lactonase
MEKQKENGLKQRIIEEMPVDYSSVPEGSLLPWLKDLRDKNRITHYIHYFSGGGLDPDANAVDENGNIYQVLHGTGSVAILDKNGNLLARVLIPGREKGEHLEVTSLTFKPQSGEVFVVAGDINAGIFTFHGFVNGLSLYSHQQAIMVGDVKQE